MLWEKMSFERFFHWRGRLLRPTRAQSSLGRRLSSRFSRFRRRTGGELFCHDQFIPWRGRRKDLGGKSRNAFTFGLPHPPSGDSAVLLERSTAKSPRTGTSSPRATRDAAMYAIGISIPPPVANTARTSSLLSPEMHRLHRDLDRACAGPELPSTHLRWPGRREIIPRWRRLRLTAFLLVVPST